MILLAGCKGLDVRSAYINNQHVRPEIRALLADPAPGRDAGVFHISDLGIVQMKQMTRIVPNSNRWLGQIVFIAERAQTRSIQHEKSSGGGFQIKPASSKNS